MVGFHHFRVGSRSGNFLAGHSHFHSRLREDLVPGVHVGRRRAFSESDRHGIPSGQPACDRNRHDHGRTGKAGYEPQNGHQYTRDSKPIIWPAAT